MEKAREMSISAQILQKRKELEELEYQAKKEKANDTIDAVVKAIAGRDHVRETLSNFSPEEGRIIGQRIGNLFWLPALRVIMVEQTPFVRYNADRNNRK